MAVRVEVHSCVILYPICGVMVIPVQSAASSSHGQQRGTSPGASAPRGEA